MTAISFQTAFIAIVQIFLMGAVGYLMVHRRFVDEGGLKTLSWVSMNISFPFFIFYQITTHFNPSVQSYWWTYPLINIGLCLGGFLMAGVLSGLLRQKCSTEWQAIASFHNAGYIPLLLVTMLPLAEKTSELYSYVILTIIGFDLCLWTLGISVMAHSRRSMISWKSFINPPLLSMFLAFALVLAGFKDSVPDLVMKPVKLIGDSALAVAMLIIGGNLALTRFDKIIWRKVSGAAVIKLIVIPAFVFVILKIARVDNVWGFILMIQACMPSSISLSIFARYYDNPSQQLINQTIFITHLLCGLTIPLFLGLYAKG